MLAVILLATGFGGCGRHATSTAEPRSFPEMSLDSDPVHLCKQASFSNKFYKVEDVLFSYMDGACKAKNDCPTSTCVLADESVTSAPCPLVFFCYCAQPGDRPTCVQPRSNGNPPP